MKAADSIVLVPGLMCDETVWRHQIDAFGADYEVRVADHGMLNSLGAMAERILDEAAPTFALVGHSMGGRVALEVLARAPERVARVALLDTGYKGVAPGEAGEREALLRMGHGFWLACVLGAAVAGVSGYLSLRVVLRTLGSEVFHRFAWYCLPLGLVVVAVGMSR